MERTGRLAGDGSQGGEGSATKKRAVGLGGYDSGAISLAMQRAGVDHYEFALFAKETPELIWKRREISRDTADHVMMRAAAGMFQQDLRKRRIS